MRFIKKEGVSMISVGMDVSKGKSSVCILKAYGEVLAAPYEVTHTVEDLQQLVDRLHNATEDVRVVLEATGQYHWPVVHFLQSKGLFVCCVNALRMKRYCSQSLHRAKTDRIDSIKIANYGITYWSELEELKQPEQIYNELRTYSRQYYQYLNLLVKAKLNLSNLLDQTMPEIQKKMVDQGENHKLSDFVARYWHYENILKMGGKRFAKDSSKWAKKEGYRMNERQAQQIYSLAQSGIPTLPATPSTKVLIVEAVHALQNIEDARNVILAHMSELAKMLPEYETVRAMHGVGDVLAPCLIAEIGDIKRFHSNRALIAYAGIDAPPYQSGTFYGTQRSISKRGNRYLRKVGYETMQTLSRVKPQDDAVYQFMLKKEQEGKPKKVAKIAAFNKFLRIYYARVNEAQKMASDEIVAI